MRLSSRSILLAWCVLLPLWPVCGSAADNGGGFALGNAFYAQGKFTEAAGAYELQVRRGEYSANLFYNLGNTYYRLGDRGHSILNYHRALLLEPAHAEAAANLSFVRGRSAAPPAGAAGWWQGVVSLLGVDGWTWLAVTAGWLGILGLAGVFFRRFRWPGVVLAVLAGCACALSIPAVWWLDGGMKNPGRAIVLVDNTGALYSPADNSKTVLVLRVGDEVRVLSEQGAWTYVQLGDGERGWVLADKIETVIPRGATKAVS